MKIENSSGSCLNLNSFKDSHVMVVGDVMLDCYLWGDVNRISPEAPVPVFNVKKKSDVAGGAGNVLSNLSGLGCEVTIIGLCGKDEPGKRLRTLLSNERVHASLIEDSQRPTIVKTRVVSNSQQLIRLDEEIVFPVLDDIRKKLTDIIEKKIESCHTLIISDYGKGIFQTDGVTEQIIKIAKKNNTPVFVDPKGKNWERYKSATCITPNTKELETVYGKSIESKEELIEVMENTIREFDLSSLLVTQGARGMCLLQKGGNPQFIPAQAKEVFDVSGAGDTVISTFTACISIGMDTDDAAKLSNIAAGIVVGKVGTQPINIFELKTSADMDSESISGGYIYKIASRSAAKLHIQLWQANGERVVFTNGCFDLLHPGHIHLLNKARELGDRLVVGLNDDASIKRLKGSSRPILNEHDRASILASLECVDSVIIFSEDTPESLIDTIRPDILVKGADYRIDEVVGKDIVESYGGEVKLVNTLEGYSTTNIAQKVLDTHNRNNNSTQD